VLGTGIQLGALPSPLVDDLVDGVQSTLLQSILTHCFPFVTLISRYSMPRSNAMHKVLHTHVDVTIDREPAEVWSVVSDYARDTVWRKGILEMTPDAPGAPRVGTKVREVLRLAGKEYTTDTVVTDAGPGMTYAFAGDGTSGGVRGRRTVRAGESAASAVFSYDVELEPAGLPRPVQPLLSWWLTRSMRRDLRRLRDLIEAA
jgi:Polyketide cyclase / dehydrase and lipid transport